MGFINAIKGAYKGFLNNKHNYNVISRQTREHLKLLLQIHLHITGKHLVAVQIEL